MRRLPGFDEPQETRVFLAMSAFGIAIGVVYWFLAYEVAGTILLLGFGVATGVIGARLVADPASATVRSAARDRAAFAGAPAGDAPAGDAAGDAPGGGTGGIDRPFEDERGRLPAETIAPFVLGLGVATSATSVIFGPAPLIVGVLPIAWGAWSWLSSVRAELDATEAERDATEARPDETGTSPPTTTEPEDPPAKLTRPKRRRNEPATKSNPRTSR
jgi:hypothetical protein